MMKYFVTVNGKKFEVEVEKVAESKERARSTSNHVMAASVSPAKKYKDAPSSEVAGAEEALKSPMPGTITSIKVTEGEKVEKGRILCILEAMKMENEIMAPRDAVISKIVVTTGTSVKAGDRLVLLI